MQTLTSIANFMAPIWVIISPFAVPGFFWLAWMGVKELQRRGYSTTYANALIRAVGAGYQKSVDAGVNPMSPAGRAIVAAGGAAYLMAQLPAVISWLKMPESEHAIKVDAQFGAMIAQAAAGGGLDAAALLKMAATSAITVGAAGLTNPDGSPMTPEQVAEKFSPMADSSGLTPLSVGRG